jgi:hypothetical protein
MVNSISPCRLGRRADIQLLAYPCGALAHSRHPVVAGAAFFYDSRLHAASINPDAQPQQPVAIRGFRLDPARLAWRKALRTVSRPIR